MGLARAHTRPSANVLGRSRHDGRHLCLVIHLERIRDVGRARCLRQHGRSVLAPGPEPDPHAPPSRAKARAWLARPDLVAFGLRLLLFEGRSNDVYSQTASCVSSPRRSPREPSGIMRSAIMLRRETACFLKAPLHPLRSSRLHRFLPSQLHLSFLSQSVHLLVSYLLFYPSLPIVTLIVS